jgi:GDP-mannose 6-dehydrogenase
LIETLVGRGYEVRVYDKLVEPDKLIGANRSFLEREIPHIASLMQKSVEDVVSASEVIVIANGSAAFREVPPTLNEDQILIDLVGIARGQSDIKGTYEGICW